MNQIFFMQLDAHQIGWLNNVVAYKIQACQDLLIISLYGFNGATASSIENYQTSLCLKPQLRVLLSQLFLSLSLFFFSLKGFSIQRP